MLQSVHTVDVILDENWPAGQHEQTMLPVGSAVNLPAGQLTQLGVCPLALCVPDGHGAASTSATMQANAAAVVYHCVCGMDRVNIAVAMNLIMTLFSLTETT